VQDHIRELVRQHEAIEATLKATETPLDPTSTVGLLIFRRVC